MRGGDEGAIEGPREVGRSDSRSAGARRPGGHCDVRGRIMRARRHRREASRSSRSAVSVSAGAEPCPASRCGRRVVVRAGRAAPRTATGRSVAASPKARTPIRTEVTRVSPAPRTDRRSGPTSAPRRSLRSAGLSRCRTSPVAGSGRAAPPWVGRSCQSPAHRQGGGGSSERHLPREPRGREPRIAAPHRRPARRGETCSRNCSYVKERSGDRPVGSSTLPVAVTAL